MRILMVGAGGVGDAAARIAVERDFTGSEGAAQRGMPVQTTSSVPGSVLTADAPG